MAEPPPPPPAHPAKAPVVVVTDIGRDVDDTIALLTAAGSGAFDVVGVVTTGGSGEKRCASCAHWLKSAGLGDVPMCIGDADEDYEDASALGCSTDPEWTAPENVRRDPEAFFVELAEKHVGELVIVCLGPLLPLSKAVDADKDGALWKIKGIGLQGSVEEVMVDSGEVDEETGEPKMVGTGKLAPLEEAFNFRQHMESARNVMDKLSGFVRFRVCSKHAAYSVKMLLEDLVFLGPNAGEAVAEQTALFRMNNRPKFMECFALKSEFEGRTELYDKDDWYNYTTHACTPYDPLVLMSFSASWMFDFKQIGTLHLYAGVSQEETNVRKPAEFVKLITASCTSAVEAGKAVAAAAAAAAAAEAEAAPADAPAP